MYVKVFKSLSFVGAALIVSLVAFTDPRKSSEPSVLASEVPGDHPVRVLVLTGVSNHDWRRTTPVLSEILQRDRLCSVDVCEDPTHRVLEEPEVAGYDVLVLNFHRRRCWPRSVSEGFVRFVESGGGVVSIHAANNSFPDWPDFERLIGGAWREGSFHPPYQRLSVEIDPRDHPITRGLRRFETTDELYCNLRIEPRAVVLATARGPRTRHGAGNAVQPVAWVCEAPKDGGGRVFHLTLGHDAGAMLNASFGRLLRRGTAWCAGRLGTDSGPAPTGAEEANLACVRAKPSL